jgi:sialate O-acetylesterase
MFTSICTFVAVLLLSPLGLMAQDDEPTGVAKVQAKLAIELGAPFCDQAVLQREMPVPVWGWSKPGTKISVEFAGQKKTTETGKDGKWMVKLDPLKASDQPADLVIGDNAGKKVVLKNILVGEVWMASGQSNMQWTAGKCDSPEANRRSRQGRQRETAGDPGVRGD